MSSLTAANLTQPLNLSFACAATVEVREILPAIFELTPKNFAFLPPTWDVKIGFITAFGLILLLGLLFNTLIIIWILRGKPKRTSTDIYVVSLCITDLMSACTTIPLDIAQFIFDFNWLAFPESHSPALCKVSAYFQTASQCISQLTLVLIAIDRYIAICHPLFHYKLKDRRQTISLICTAAVWLVGLTVSIVDAVFVQLTVADSLEAKNLTYVPDAEYYHQHKELIIGAKHINDTCEEVNIYQACAFDPNLSAVYDTLLFAVMYVLPQLMLAFCYTSVCFRLWVRPAVGDTMPLDYQAARKKKSNKRITIVMLAIVITFGVLWLPYWCKLMYDRHTQTQRVGAVQFNVGPPSFTVMARLCIVTSPIIYVILDRAFQNRIRAKTRAFVECIKPSLSEVNQTNTKPDSSSHHTDDTKRPTQNDTRLKALHSNTNT